MMKWTDRHCRFFHRLFTPNPRLYSEMITAKAVIHGARDMLLGYSPAEHPLAVQLGGADAGELAKATEIAAGFGYDEVNLNCGCPSPRVKSGEFGATLMRNPRLVYELLNAMRTASGGMRVSVKCRIGVDDTPESLLPSFLDHVSKAGVRHVIIHARKAWLKGLSPKDNRTIPPLDYAQVYRMKAEFPDLHISINGGITTPEQAKTHIEKGIDGVMVGRTAYHNPREMLCGVEKSLFANPNYTSPDDETIITAMADYIDAHCAEGGRAHQVTRHMFGLFNNRAGARKWRQSLTTNAQTDMRGDILYAAYEAAKKSTDAHEFV